jgi:hypothetical protein
MGGRSRRSRNRSSGRGAPVARRRRPGADLAPWLPPIAAVLLALPGFQWTWLWDDFDFLARVQTFRPEFLLPDPHSLFYRPVSREVYFSLVWLLGKGSPFAGHLLNAVLLALVTVLLVSVATRLAGRMAGLFAGFAFAFFGAAPFLVAWVSGAQDLLALLFTLAGIRLQLGGRSWAAALLLVPAVLSKEVAVAVVPVAAALPWLLRRPPEKPAAHLLPYLAVLAAWASIHPGIRILAARGFGAGEAGYLGLGVPHRGQFLGWTLLTFANVPVSGIGAPWPKELAPWFVTACLLAIVALGALAGRRNARPPAGDRAPVSGVILLGVLIAIGPTLIAAALVRVWSPHYSVFPAAGFVLLLGIAFARLPSLVALPLLLIYAGLGVWSRGPIPDPSIPCEANMRPQSAALEAVRKGFTSLYQRLPSGTVALVSVGSTGPLAVHEQMIRFQALRIWYRDPTIQTYPPERRPAGSRTDLLFRITPDLIVVEIDPDRCLFRSSGARPDPLEVSRPARTYARAVAGGGDPGRAVHIQEQIARLDRGELRFYDLRLAGMYLLAAGRREEAERMLDSIPAPPRSRALDLIKKLYQDATPGLSVEEYAFPAFGIENGDLEANQEIMRRLREDGYLPMATRFARRVLDLAPADSESKAIIDEWRRSGARDLITVPVGADSPPGPSSP